ncbi:MAG: FAD-dependent oxidoreductase [Actinomycetota bacterium]
MSGRRIVIIGAGVVGVGLADELARLGERDITVIDKGPLFATGGSSAHAPGLVSRTSTSKFLSDTADYTIRKFQALSTGEGPAFPGLGTLEVAYNEARLQELWRRHDAARSFGWRGRMIEPDEALSLWPIINPDGLIGAYTTEDEGLAASLRAVEAMGERAADAGVTFLGETEVTGFQTTEGKVTGVVVAGGGGGGDAIPADVVICCAGVWGPKLGASVGLTLPVMPMEHQYAITTDIPQLAGNAAREATMPILRHHDIGIYFRDHGAGVGIGSFHHRALPVAPEAIDGHERNVEDGLAFAFTDEDWTEAWELVAEFLPPVADAGLASKFNGIFGFTPDGYPVVGEHPELAGLWFALSIWVTHSQGVARAVAQTLVDGGSEMDLSPADLSRFDERELEPSFFEPRCEDQYRDVYVAHHPVEPGVSARDIRFSPFAERQRELGAVFFNVATWERPQWYEANATLADGLPPLSRDEWSGRHWSPIAVAEHLATRERAGLFDMTPLYRIEVTGPGAEAFLLRMIAARTDRPVGSVVYSVLLDERGGIRSDVTVTRLAEDRYWIGGNGPRDLAWIRAHAPSDGSVALRFISDDVACAGLWGPAARDILSSVTDADLSNDAFPYLTTQEISVAGVRVTAVRISYAGELGWELTSTATDGPALWDSLWSAGQARGLVAGGRAALGTLRLEKGYRAWGTELTPEYGPVESGLGFAVRRDDSEFLGRAGVLERGEAAARRLRCLVLEGEQVVMGSEPVMAGDECVGYVTSGGWGASVGESIAYGWVDDLLGEGDAVEVWYFDRHLAATIASEPRFDPAGERVRS